MNMSSSCLFQLEINLLVKGLDSGNNPEEISNAALRLNFLSKFYFDLKKPKMVFK